MDVCRLQNLFLFCIKLSFKRHIVLFFTYVYLYIFVQVKGLFELPGDSFYTLNFAEENFKKLQVVQVLSAQMGTLQFIVRAMGEEWQRLNNVNVRGMNNLFAGVEGSHWHKCQRDAKAGICL